MSADMDGGVPVYEIKGELIRRVDSAKCGYDAVIFWETVNEDGKTKTGHAVNVKYADKRIKKKAEKLNRHLVSARGLPLRGPKDRMYNIVSIERMD